MTLSINGAPATGFNDRSIIVHVKETGLQAGQLLFDSAGNLIKPNANGEFNITIPYNSNSASFSLKDASHAVSDTVAFSLIGYQEQRYLTSNHTAYPDNQTQSTPDGQVLLTDTAHTTASISVVGIAHGHLGV